MPFGMRVCPFCERPQDGAPDHTQRIRQSGCVTVNIKDGMPTVDEGTQRLQRHLTSLQSQGVSLVRIIHGWGSGGTGGKLKKATREQLSRMRSRRIVKQYVCGEDYSPHTEVGRNLLRKYPELKKQLRTDQNNPGITLVELG